MKWHATAIRHAMWRHTGGTLRLSPVWGVVKARLGNLVVEDGCFQWRTHEFCSGGGSTNSVEDRENGDLRAVAR